MSTVLEKYYDPSYEPSTPEIDEYGKWLGMDLPADNDLLFLAREGLKAPLPEGWKACKSEKGELYYFNFKSGKSIWDHPMDDHYKETLADHKRRKAAGEPYGVNHHTPVSVPAAKEGSPTPSATSDTSSEKQSSESRADSQPPQQAADASEAEVAPKIQEVTKRTRPSSSKRNKTKQSISETQQDVETTVAFTEAAIPDAVVEHKTAPVSGSKLAALKTLKTKKDLPKELVLPSADDPTFPLSTLSPANTPAPMNIDDNPSLATTTLKRKTSTSRIVSFVDEQRVEADNAEATRQTELKVQDAKKKALEEANAEIAAFEQKQLDRIDAEKKKIRQSFVDQVEKFEKENTAQIQQRKKQLQIELEKVTQTTQESHAATMSSTKDLHEQELTSLKNKHQALLDQTRSTSSADLARAVQAAKDGHVNSVQNSLNDCLATLETDIARMLKEHSAILVRGAIRDCAAASSIITTEGEDEIGRIKENHRRQLEELRLKQASELEEAEGVNAGAIGKLKEELSKMEANKEAELTRINTEVEVATKAAAMSIAAAQRFVVESANASTSDMVVAVSPPAPAPIQPLSPQLLEVPKSSVQHQDPFSNPSSSSTSPSSSHQPTTAGPLSGDEVRVAIEDALRSIFASTPQQQQQQYPLVPAPSALPTRPFVDQRATTVDLNTTLPICFEDQRRMLEAERGRLVQARQVVDAQQKDILERQRNLKDAKKQWKSDVIKAKNAGVRGESEKGQLLRNVHKALERQEAVLQHDENVHQQSEMWLQTKADRLHSIEMQLHSIERQPDLDMSAASETSAMINDFFHTESLTYRPRHSVSTTNNNAAKLSSAFSATSSHQNNQQQESEVAKALRRIEKRLDRFANAAAATAAPDALLSSSTPSSWRPPLGELAKLNMIPQPAPTHLSSKHSRKRSSSASKRVGFAPLSPTSYI